MEGDPKGPNAWWAVKIQGVGLMEDLRKIPRKRLYWLVPLLLAIASAEIFGLYKLGMF